MRSLCIVAYSDYPTDARVMRHAEAAVRNGYRVDVVTPTDGRAPAKESAGAVTIYRLRTKHYEGESRAAYVASYLDFFIRCFFWLSLRHARWRYNVVHACNMPDFLVFTALLARLMGARTILDIHDPMPDTYRAKFPSDRRGFLYRLLLWQERLSAAFADRVVTVSDPVKNDVLVPDGLDGRKISVITNFPDDEIFKPGQAVPLGYPIRMIYYGTIAPRFDLEGVLSALSAVRQKDRVNLRIIGKGASTSSLRAAIAAAGLASLVELDDASYPVRELPGIVRDYHLGIVPYRPSFATDHILPVKLMELLAMGIPSITIANSAIRHYINPRMYFAYDPGDISSLTRIVEDILDQPSVIADKRQVILEDPHRHLWKRMREEYLDLLSQLSR
jgi:glycosyltransferase involved in cell wall biosynthesis